MSTPTALVFLEDLQTRGAVVTIRPPDRLRVEAPAGVLTEEDRAHLRQYKAELLALVAGHDPLPAPLCLTCRRRPTTPHSPYRCPDCVARAHTLCAAWRPGDGPIILAGDPGEEGQP